MHYQNCYFPTAIDVPTHVLLHFEVDDTVCAAPVKRVIHPPLSEIIVGRTCRVRWNARREFDATLLCLGKELL